MELVMNLAVPSSFDFLADLPGVEPSPSLPGPRSRTRDLGGGVSLFDRLVPALHRDAVPATVRADVEPVLALLDGRPVAEVVVASPLPAQITLRLLDKLMDVGAATTMAAAAAAARVTPEPVALAPELVAVAPEPSPTVVVEPSLGVAPTLRPPVAPVMAAPQPIAPEVGFTDFEEAFFASEAAEIVHERRLAALGDL